MTAAELIGILKTAGFNEMPMVGGNALFFGSGSSLTCFIPPGDRNINRDDVRNLMGDMFLTSYHGNESKCLEAMNAIRKSVFGDGDVRYRLIP